MKDDSTNLENELEQFKKEKENIRDVMGKIGGSDSTKKDKIINLVFIIVLSGLFTLDFLRHLEIVKFGWSTLFSLEIGILLISVKIIWLIEKQIKVNHFQFWILNSIEFRLNTVSNKILGIEKKLDEKLKDKNSD